MTTEFIKNGNFADKFEHWKQVNEFELRFEPYGEGNSIYVPVDSAIEQSILPIRGKTMRIEFEVRSDKAIENTIFLVNVGGVANDGGLHMSPIIDLVTHRWKKVSVRCYFEVPLSKCFVRASEPVTAMAGHRVSTDLDARQDKQKSLWFANFSLIEELEA